MPCLMLTVHNFTYGRLTRCWPICSRLGAFLALRSTSRAQAQIGPLPDSLAGAGAVTLGAVGIWVMHLIAMLGFTIPGDTILSTASR